MDKVQDKVPNPQYNILSLGLEDKIVINVEWSVVGAVSISCGMLISVFFILPIHTIVYALHCNIMRELIM